jgi:hypothetical protein
MTNRLIATVLAASLALTSLAAAPARAADNGEIGRFLLGAGTLFIIGSALANNNSRPQVTQRYFEPAPRYVQPPRWRHDHGYGHGPRQVGPNRHKVKPRVARLPQQCARKVWGKNGPRTVYPENCLRKYGYFARR